MARMSKEFGSVCIRVEYTRRSFSMALYLGASHVVIQISKTSPETRSSVSSLLPLPGLCSCKETTDKLSFALWLRFRKTLIFERFLQIQRETCLTKSVTSSMEAEPLATRNFAA